MAKYHVIFRTCDAVHSVHHAPRPFGLSKLEIIKLSFLSLVEALAPFDHTIEVLGDKLSQEAQAFFNEFPVKLTLKVMGNDESIRETVRLASKVEPGTWVCFCEDDYLHTPDAFHVIDDLIANRSAVITHRPKHRFTLGTKLSNRDLVIHPPDYPDRYIGKRRRPSFLFTTQHHHWRQIANTTFTFLMLSDTVRKYERILMHSATGANDHYLSRSLYYGHDSHGPCLCLSPVPGVATHLHTETMTPIVNWNEVYDRYRQQIGK